MEIEKKDISAKTNDDKELVVIDYFDRINNKWIKVETTKEVARYLQSSKKYKRYQSEEM